MKEIFLKKYYIYWLDKLLFYMIYEIIIVFLNIKVIYVKIYFYDIV